MYIIYIHKIYRNSKATICNIRAHERSLEDSAILRKYFPKFIY